MPCGWVLLLGLILLQGSMQRMDQGKGETPRCGSSNSFLSLQNKGGLLLHSTGRSMGGSCSCTHYLQAEASRDLWF